MAVNTTVSMGVTITTHEHLLLLGRHVPRAMSRESRMAVVVHMWWSGKTTFTIKATFEEGLMDMRKCHHGEEHLGQGNDKSKGPKVRKFGYDKYSKLQW